MTLRIKTLVIALVGAALIATLVLISTSNQMKKASNMISNAVRGEKSQRWQEMEDRANTRNLQQGNILAKVLESIERLEKGLKKPQMNMKASSQTQDAKDPLRITQWWQASSLLKWDWEKPPEYTCSKIETKGNWHVCNDNKFEVKPPCLVYSFGIWDDWSFDDAMGALGCEVHSFDPSIGLKPFDRSNNVHFHDLGLSGKDSDTYVPTKDIYVKETTTWKIRRLETIMEMLGHTNRHLDYLKIDIETSEWPAVKDIVESGLFSKIRQFSVEWHLFPTYPSRSEYVGIYASLVAMKEQGLRTYRADFHGRDYANKTFRFQADVNYVNVLYETKDTAL